MEATVLRCIRRHHFVHVLHELESNFIANIVLFLIDLQGTNGLPGDKGEVGVTGSPVSSCVTLRKKTLDKRVTSFEYYTFD